MHLSIEEQEKRAREKRALDALVLKNMKQRAAGGKAGGLRFAINRDGAALQKQADQLRDSCLGADAYKKIYIEARVE